MTEGVNVGETLGEKRVVNQEAAQQICQHERDASHAEVVQQSNGAEKLRSSIEHSQTAKEMQDLRPRGCGRQSAKLAQ